MANGKPLRQLGADLRAGLAISTELVAHDVTMELKKRGPYWTGDFEKAWVVEPGSVLIESTRKDTTTMEQIDGKAAQRQLTPVIVPPADDTNLIGYTIGNEMEYADIAMDLEPGDDGNYRGERPRQTSPDGLNWFEGYMLDGEANRTIEKSVTQGMGLAGFR